MKTITKHIVYHVCGLVMALLYAGPALCQNNPYYTISYQDSLQKDPNSDFIYNNITITNIYSNAISVNVGVAVPDGWALLGNNQAIIELAPGQSNVFPLVLSKTLSTLSEWLPVNIQIQLKNAPVPTDYKFFVKAKIKTGYSASAIDRSIELTAYQPSVDLKLFLRNKGNAQQHFDVEIISPFFQVDKSISFSLAPFKDTNIIYSLNISSGAWKDLKEEIVKLWITNDSGKKFFYTYSIKRLKSKVEEHQSAYPTVPVTVEGGISSYGNNTIFYGGASGAIKLTDQSNISFYFRSRQYGLGGYQPSQYLLIYNYKKWQLSAGMISPEAQPFYTSGQGIKLKHSWNNGDFISFYGIKHYADTLFSSDCIGSAIRYHINKIVLFHMVGADFDSRNHLNSYVESNSIELLNNSLVQAHVIAGVGLEHSTLNLANNPNDVLGKSIGYDFALKYKNVSLLSNLLNNDNNYPGVYKGYRNQNQSINYKIKRSFIGLFYESNYTSSNYFRDSIYVVNNALNNMSNYGVRAGWADRRTAVVVGSGIITQLGVPNTPPRYQSFTLDYTYTGNAIRIMSNSLAGINNIVGQSKDNDIAIISQRLVVSTNYGGVQAYYSRMPNYNTNSSLNENQPYTENINYGPYVCFSMFRKTLTARFQYNVNYLTNAATYSSAGGMLTYDNKKAGLGLTLTGFIPTNKQQATSQSFSLTVRKLFNVPVVTHRKYYDLSVVVFDDANGNGQLDGDEKPLQNIIIYINNLPLVTDKKGKLTYSNIEKGTYKLDFSKRKSGKGLMPAAGDVQVANVIGNTSLYIPFKKGNLLSGKVTFSADSVSRSSFTADNIKIIVTDTSGKIFTTLTDDAGEFYFNLPSATYNVSLDPGSFDESIKPKQMSYNVNLSNNQEAEVIFEIQKKAREVKIMQVTL